MNLCHLKETNINLSQKNSIYLDTIWCASLGEMVGLSLKYLKCLDQILWPRVWPTVTNDDYNNECIGSLAHFDFCQVSQKLEIQQKMWSQFSLYWLSQSVLPYIYNGCLWENFVYKLPVYRYQNPKFEVTAKATVIPWNHRHS